MVQQLSDKDIAGDVLSSFKLSASGYLHGVLEAQDQSIRQTFVDYQNQCLSSQERIFRYMQDQGWYKVPMNQETGAGF
jgi:spore coat protein CotF